MERQSTNLQDRYNLSRCRVDGQVSAHAVLGTNNDVRSHTGGEYLKLGQ